MEGFLRTDLAEVTACLHVAITIRGIDISSTVQGAGGAGQVEVGTVYLAAARSPVRVVKSAVSELGAHFRLLSLGEAKQGAEVPWQLTRSAL